MIKERSVSFVSEISGRVDKAASSFMQRSCFSRPDTSILINGKSVKKSAKVNAGDRVEITYSEEVFENLEAENLPLSILYEDESILVIDKKQGMQVHPGSGVNTGTLANALLFRYGEDFSTSDDDTRPGIVHRLDKDTSGVMVVAKTLESHNRLSSQFASHSNRKYYLAIVKGYMPSRHGIIEKSIARDPGNRKRFSVTERGGKDAKTEYYEISAKDGYSLLLVRIYTGRTHQIRVHLSSLSHPVLGDPVYSRKDPLFPDATLMLHALFLEFVHPSTGETVSFHSSYPERFSCLFAPSEAISCAISSIIGIDTVE
ncbi:MAG: RluA family pseudouridine synthase [Candidatus Ornithospirochaeta sp.]|nr:RluA family pseudouridine synthase [Candidatus Ornithospirochaeta sp.]